MHAHAIYMPLISLLGINLQYLQLPAKNTTIIMYSYLNFNCLMMTHKLFNNKT